MVFKQNEMQFQLTKNTIEKRIQAIYITKIPSSDRYKTGTRGFQEFSLFDSDTYLPYSSYNISKWEELQLK